MPNITIYALKSKFQNDNNLTIDGIMKPDGETTVAMGRSPRFKCPGLPRPFMDGCGNIHAGASTYCPNCITKGMILGIL